MRHPHLSIRAAALLCLVSASAFAEQNPKQEEFFEKRIRPLLVKHCYDCHGPDLAEGKLRLDTKSGWERGGERGPAIVPGDPSSSLLIRAVSQADDKLRMPPPDSGDKLSDAAIDDLRTWIRQGAADPRTGEKIVSEIEKASREHWAFQPLAPPSIPGQAHPVDFLIERQLREHGFVVTEPADLRTLVRRTTFDLIGLPPTEKQLATTREGFPQLVKDLLASPQYGERWGRHWLDVARYSDAKDGVLMYGDARVRPFAYGPQVKSEPHVSLAIVAIDAAGADIPLTGTCRFEVEQPPHWGFENCALNARYFQPDLPFQLSSNCYLTGAIRPPQGEFRFQFDSLNSHQHPVALRGPLAIFLQLLNAEDWRSPLDVRRISNVASAIVDLR